MKISLCMIVKDEEETLERCLSSAAELVDEIVIVDTGSVDKTKEIAYQFTEKVYDFPWIDDFAAARNFAFSKASPEADYLMWLDADDVIERSDAVIFAKLKSELLGDISAVFMPYHVGFDTDGAVNFTYDRERLVRNDKTMGWVGEVHEVIQVRGKTVRWPCAVTHKKLKIPDKDRNLRIFEGLIRQGKTLELRQQYYYGRELVEHGEYEKGAEVLEEYLAAGGGWVENQIDACRQLSRCYFGLNRQEEGLFSLFRSFCYDLPRAEVCCDIGGFYMDRQDWNRAIFWYKLVAEGWAKGGSLVGEEWAEGGQPVGFVQPDLHGYIPALQLCVCYDRLGDYGKAQHWNEAAAKFKPNSPQVAHNRAYFAREARA